MYRTQPADHTSTFSVYYESPEVKISGAEKAAVPVLVRMWNAPSSLFSAATLKSRMKTRLSALVMNKF